MPMAFVPVSRGAEWECRPPLPSAAGRCMRTCRAFGGRVAAGRHGARGQAREYLIIMEAFRVMANGNRTEPSGSGLGTGLTRDRPDPSTLPPTWQIQLHNRSM